MTQEPLKVLIADDDAGIRMILSKYIGKTEGFALCGMAENGQQALDMAGVLRPDVIFLDVDMPVLSGLECARLLQDEDPSRILIFATGHEEYRGEAFEVYAFDYLVKPFNLDRLRTTLDRILQVRRPIRPALNTPPAVGGKLMLKHKDGVVFPDLEDILLVQREDRSTVYYTRDGGRFESAESLSEAEERLDPTLFFRCHKSYIINLRAVRSITPYGRWTWVVTLEGTDRDALITKEKYDELQQMFT